MHLYHLMDSKPSSMERNRSQNLVTWRTLLLRTMATVQTTHRVMTDNTCEPAVVRDCGFIWIRLWLWRPQKRYSSVVHISGTPHATRPLDFTGHIQIRDASNERSTTANALRRPLFRSNTRQLTSSGNTGTMLDALSEQVPGKLCLSEMYWLLGINAEDQGMFSCAPAIAIQPHGEGAVSSSNSSRPVENVYYSETTMNLVQHFNTQKHVKLCRGGSRMGISPYQSQNQLIFHLRSKSASDCMYWLLVAGSFHESWLIRYIARRDRLQV